MLRAAPPAFVIGALLQVSWIALWLLPLPSRASYDLHAYSYEHGLVMAGTVLVIAGVDQLRRRSRARNRMWLALAMAAMGLTLVLHATVFVVVVRLQIVSPPITVALRAATGWVAPLLYIVAVLALALAGGRRTLTLGIASFVTSLVTQTPALVQVAGPDAAWLGGLVGRLVVEALLVLVAGSIAEHASAPTQSYDRAILGLRWLAVALIIRGLVLGATAFILGGTSYAIVRIALDGLDLATALGAAWALFVIAQARLPALAPYWMQLATGAALATVVVLTYPGRWIAEVIYGHMWWNTERFVTAIPIGCELPMMVALGALSIALARRAAVRLSAVAGGVVFAAALGVALGAHTREPIWFACLAIATFAFVPTIWAVRRQLVAEPVKTTSDVFA
ncbi:hypothetical protein BH11MYX1_BH11MYX1_18970 [soil metagenome]